MKRKSKTGLKTLAITTALVLLIPVASTGGASGTLRASAASTGDVTKTETVYVNADTAGKVEKETVSNWLHSDTSGAVVHDVANLSNIKNVEGNEKPVLSGSNVTWTLSGNDLYYEGTTTKSLPVSMSVSYYLNGVETPASGLSGKSGKVEIKISFTNNDAHSAVIGSKEKTLYTPFVCAVGFDLPKKYFSNVQTNFGSVVSDGSNQVVYYMSVPGLKEDFDMLDLNEYLSISDELDITADASDFQLGPIMAVVTPVPDLDSLKNTDTVSGLLDKLDDLYDAGCKLRSATGTLNSGEKAFTDGVKELLAGISTAGTSFDKIVAGASTLSSSASNSKTGLPALSDGAKSLSSGAGSLKKGAGTLSEGTGTLLSQFDSGSSANQTLKYSIDSLNSGAKQLSAGLSELFKQFSKGSSSNQTLKYSIDSLTSGSASETSGLKTLKEQFDSGSSSNQTLKYSIDSLTSGETSYVALENQTAFYVVSSEIQALGTSYKTSIDAQKSTFHGYANTAVAAYAQALSSGTKTQQQTALSQALVNINIYNVLSAAETVADQGKDESDFESLLLSAGTASPASCLYQYNPSGTSPYDEIVAKLNAQNAVILGQTLSSGLSNLDAQTVSSGDAKNPTLYDSISALYAGSSQISGGLSKLDAQTVSSGDAKNPTLYDSISQLAGGSTQLARGTSLLDAQTVSGGKSGTTLYDAVSGLDSGARQLFAGTSTLSTGVSTLYQGTSQLSVLQSGINSLANGLLEFKDGISSLRTGTSTLYTNSKKLSSGTSKLKSGVNDLYTQALSKLKGSERDDVNEALEVKDQIVDLAENYTTFSGTGENMDSSVKFVIKTDEIDGKTDSSTASSTSSSTSTTQESRNFFQKIGDWVWNLFH